MRNIISCHLLLLLASVTGCASDGPTSGSGIPSFDSARLEPGSSFVVMIGLGATALRADPGVIVTAGPSSETSLQTICSFTPAYSSAFARVPAFLPPDLAGVPQAVSLYSDRPIPAGTRLGLTRLCAGGEYTTYVAVVLGELQ